MSCPGLALLFGLAVWAHADTLTLRDGTKIPGKWVGASADEIQFERGGNTCTYSRADVSGLVFGDSGASSQQTDCMNRQIVTPRPTKYVAVDSTIGDVEAALGRPAVLFNFGVTKIYIYQSPELKKVTFSNGKVARIE